MYNFRTPRKRDDREWDKAYLSVLVQESGLDLCSWSCCVPNTRKNDFNSLTLSQYKSRIRKRLKHRQGEIPKKYQLR